MFRTTVIRTARVASRSLLPRRPLPVVLQAVRMNSTETPASTEGPPTAADPPTETPAEDRPLTPEEARKAFLEARNDLARDWDAKVIPYEEFVVKTENPNIDTYIIDVREKEEVMQGMIPSSVNIPMTVLSEALHMDGEDFAKRFGFAKPLVTQEVIFYCRSGMRSSSACDIAKRNRYENILNYKGSWMEWTAKLNEKGAASSKPEPSS